ncbi:Streptomyces sporulation and cell division protein, SsgA [Prauserella marina]|uniref:Streptomyces sporulation and cell division protein, SsgA n=1 Tax=Prauserella marina TaxID=530584 RepID=A0A1G6NL36_9PSEU|nr:SsgA family sporulation/cell division regulator [Prauserella marina]PWV82415.1 sporulation and cell division protein SsgA [Prauserella marina]SDC68603.1 Streptomyces sporulation and cell division protein, SsgA [Prauserella marina]
MQGDAVHQSQFVHLNGCSTPVLSRLSYTTADPFTIAIAFRIDAGEWIEWEFARDLLIEGLDEPTGIGDIRIRPDLSPDEEVLVFELESPDGYAVVEIKRKEVELFVDATMDFVPQGTESAHLDIDAVIADLTTARP